MNIHIRKKDIVACIITLFIIVFPAVGTYLVDRLAEFLTR